MCFLFFFFFFFNDTATTEIYTLSLHDALPIFGAAGADRGDEPAGGHQQPGRAEAPRDRKSTRLNSSHRCISYAVFCLKKKKNNNIHQRPITRNKLSTISKLTPHMQTRTRHPTS